MVFLFLMCLGGEECTFPVEDTNINVLNMNLNEWSILKYDILSPFPSKRQGHSFNIISNTIYLFGGMGFFIM